VETVLSKEGTFVSLKITVEISRDINPFKHSRQ
jgi:hypothetical protein